jgi:hypothetical protein
MELRRVCCAAIDFDLPPMLVAIARIRNTFDEPNRPGERFRTCA